MTLPPCPALPRIVGPSARGPTSSLLRNSICKNTLAQSGILPRRCRGGPFSKADKRSLVRALRLDDRVVRDGPSQDTLDLGGRCRVDAHCPTGPWGLETETERTCPEPGRSTPDSAGFRVRGAPRTPRGPGELRLSATRLPGLEPGTLGLEGRCSIQLSYRRSGGGKPTELSYQSVPPRSTRPGALASGSTT